MNMKITEGLTVTERRNQKGENHYSRYLPSFFIDDDCFSSAIKRLGGDTYNVCVGKVGEVTIFNGYTWFSVSNVNSYDDCDMWAERVEMEIYEGIGTISPIHIHHPVPGLHSWGIEFNRDRLFWDRIATDFVKEARKLLDSGWFYQSGSDHPDSGYQFFEFLGDPAREEPEYFVRGHAIEIAKAIGTSVFL